jgi:hypothetical protein
MLSRLQTRHSNTKKRTLIDELSIESLAALYTRVQGEVQAIKNRIGCGFLFSWHLKS